MRCILDHNWTRRRTTGAHDQQKYDIFLAEPDADYEIWPNTQGPTRIITTVR